MLSLGEMAEWSIALSWKGSERLERSEGSNPSLSAKTVNFKEFPYNFVWIKILLLKIALNP